jgi:cyclopropane fatty-acyl-phospholipid synthase-like methyltransferase
MVSAKVYDAFYRWWAPWDAVGVRADLRALLTSGRVTPGSHPRSIDLGCGTGANVVYLADVGFESWGLDFSEVALRKAEHRRAEAGVAAHFVNGDLTADEIEVKGPFDLLLDFGTLDDLRGDAQRAMIRTVDRLSRPGSVFLCFCFFGPKEDLPLLSLEAPARWMPRPTILPGEMKSWFGDHWDVELFNPYHGEPFATFILTKRSGA